MNIKALGKASAARLIVSKLEEKKRAVRRLFMQTTLCATLALSPMLAHADECSSLRRMEGAIERQLQDLLVEYPGTLIVLGLCKEVGESAYGDDRDVGSAVLAFGVCATVGCSIAGFENCIQVVSEAFRFGMQKSLLENRRQQACA